MLSGFLSPRHTADLAALLDSFDWEYSFEVWDEATETTQEFRSGS